jgi:diguanylate cyclase (GGDEF)-like protein/PAS domain S-box-containing protein
VPVATALPDAETLFDHLADAVYLIDPVTSAIVWANRPAWASLGLSREDVLDHSVLSLQKDVHGLPQWSEIAEAIRGSDCFRFLGRHRHQAGHEVEVEVNTTHFTLGGRAYFLSVARDITNRVADQGSAHSREKQLWFALNEAVDGLWDWDVPSGHLFFSPQLKRMLGYGPEEMTPRLATWTDNLHPDDAARVRVALDEHMQGKRMRYEAEYRLRNRNGHYLWVHDRGRVCESDAQGRPTRLVGMLQDISERKQLELRLQSMAAQDMLTGLASRLEGSHFLHRQAADCERQNTPLGLAFIDIDHFKAVNDEHGHLRGDEVLQAVARLVQAGVRGSDMLCRWGGEEFLLVAPQTDVAQLAVLAEKLRLGVRDAMSAHQPPVTISVGVASADGTIDVTALLARADAALYRAKQAGRNRVECG